MELPIPHKGKCRGRPLGRPTIKPSKEGVGEAFRLPRADDIRPCDEPKECNAKTMVRRSFDFALRASLRMTGVLCSCQLSTINYQLSIINYQLSTINYQFSTINHILSGRLVIISAKWAVMPISKGVKMPSLYSTLVMEALGTQVATFLSHAPPVSQ